MELVEIYRIRLDRIRVLLSFKTDNIKNKRNSQSVLRLGIALKDGKVGIFTNSMKAKNSKKKAIMKASKEDSLLTVVEYNGQPT